MSETTKNAAACRDEKTVKPTTEFREFVGLNERARRVMRRNAKAFPLALRYAYFVGFVEGCCGVPASSDFLPAEQVAYVCGGIDGSAWA